jgi:hypothetical protein
LGGIRFMRIIRCLMIVSNQLLGITSGPRD